MNLKVGDKKINRALLSLLLLEGIIGIYSLEIIFIEPVLRSYGSIVPFKEFVSAFIGQGTQKVYYFETLLVMIGVFMGGYLIKEYLNTVTGNVVVTILGVLLIMPNEFLFMYLINFNYKLNAITMLFCRGMGIGLILLMYAQRIKGEVSLSDLSKITLIVGAIDFMTLSIFTVGSRVACHYGGYIGKTISEDVKFFWLVGGYYGKCVVFWNTMIMLPIIFILAKPYISVSIKRNRSFLEDNKRISYIKRALSMIMLWTIFMIILFIWKQKIVLAIKEWGWDETIDFLVKKEIRRDATFLSVITIVQLVGNEIAIRSKKQNRYYILLVIIGVFFFWNIRMDGRYVRERPYSIWNVLLYIYPLSFMITSYLVMRIRKKEEKRTAIFKEVFLVMMMTISNYIINIEMGRWFMAYQNFVDHPMLLATHSIDTNILWRSWRYIIIFVFIIVMFSLLLGVARLIGKGTKISIKENIKIVIDTVCILTCIGCALIYKEKYEVDVEAIMAFNKVMMIYAYKIISIMLMTYSVIRFLLRKKQDRLHSQQVMFIVGFAYWGICFARVMHTDKWMLIGDEFHIQSINYR